MRNKNSKKALAEALDQIRVLCEHSTDKGHEDPYSIIGRIEFISSGPYFEGLYKEGGNSDD